MRSAGSTDTSKSTNDGVEVVSTSTVIVMRVPSAGSSPVVVLTQRTSVDGIDVPEERLAAGEIGRGGG